MKNNLLLLFCIFTLLTTHGWVSSTFEETTIDEKITLLIKAQETSLQELKEVQKNLKIYKAQENLYLSKDDDFEALYKLSEKAYLLLSSIEKCQIQEYFRDSFLEELEKLQKPFKNKTLTPITPS